MIFGWPQGILLSVIALVLFVNRKQPEGFKPFGLYSAFQLIVLAAGGFFGGVQ